MSPLGTSDQTAWRCYLGGVAVSFRFLREWGLILGRSGPHADRTSWGRANVDVAARVRGRRSASFMVIS